MDRRRTPRHPVSPEPQSQARLTLLSPDGLSDRTLDAAVLDWSPAGLRLRVASPVSPGTPVRVDWSDQLALGDVCHCASLPDGYAIGLHVNQTMNDLESLRRLSERLMGETRQPSQV